MTRTLKQTNMLGATVEVWTNGRIFIEAPRGYSWVKNDLHTIVHPTKGLDISEAINAGLKRCEEDCTFCSHNDSSFDSPEGTMFYSPNTELSLQTIIDEMDSLALVS